MEKRSLWQGLAKWLPSRGNMVFSLLLIGALLWTQTSGMFTLAKSANVPAEVPQVMPYQGRLADATGSPLTGTYPMTFHLYDSPGLDAYPLWTENYIGPNSIKVSDGLFNVMLGSLAPIPHTLLQEHSSLWLGITVDTDNEMTPRVQLGSAPYASSANYALNAEKLNGLTAAEIINETLAQIPDATPPGVISAFGGATAPDGWLICDGRAVSRTEYPQLFTAIGTAFGAGDGSTTFNLPDLRGRFPRGWNGGTGRDENAANRVACNTGGATGDAVGTCQMDALQAHKHNDAGHVHGYRTQVIDDADEFESGDGKHGADDLWADYNTYTGYANLTDPVQSSGGAVRFGMETRPENVAVMYIIKH